MTVDVFLSYALHDKVLAQQVFDAMEDEGLAVWWDFGLVPGSKFAEEIARAVSVATTTVVLWTEASASSRWVRAEAELAYRQGKLLPVRLDGAEIPLPFNELHAVDWLTEATPAQQLVQILLPQIKGKEESGQDDQGASEALEHLRQISGARKATKQNEAIPNEHISTEELTAALSPLSELRHLSSIRDATEAANQRPKTPARLLFLAVSLASILGGTIAALTYADISFEDIKAAFVQADRSMQADPAPQAVEEDASAETQESPNLRAEDPPPPPRYMATDDRQDGWWKTGQIVLEGCTSECAVAALTHSSDGRVLALGTFGGQAYLFDLEDQTLIATVEGHRGGIRDFVFSPDGAVLFSVGGDAVVRAWSAEDGSALRTFEGHSRGRSIGGITALDLSPDGRVLVSSGTDGYVRLWDAATGTQTAQYTWTPEALSGVSFSVDGKQIAVSSFQAGSWVFDADTGRIRMRSEGHNFGYHYDIDFLPGDPRILIAGATAVYDVRTAERVFQLNGQEGLIIQADHLPLDDRLITLSSEGDVRIWSGENGTEVIRITACEARSFAVVPRDAALAIGCMDGSVSLLKLIEPTTRPNGATWQILQTYNDSCYGRQSCAAQQVDVAPDRVAAVFDDKVGRIWNAATGELVLTLPPNTEDVGRYGSYVDGLTLSPDGRLAAVYGGSGIELWDIDRAEQLLAYQEHTWTYGRAHFSADGSLLLTSRTNGVLNLFDVATASHVRSWETTGGIGGGALALSANGETVLVGGYGVQLWSLQSGELLWESDEAKGQEINSVGFSSDGSLFFAAGDGGFARVWETATFEEVSRFTLHGSGEIGHALFPGVDDRMLTQSFRRLYIWDVYSAQPLIELSTGRLVAIRPRDTPALFTVSSSSGADGIEVFDVLSGSQLGRFFGHDGQVRDMIYDAESDHLLTASADGQVRRFASQD